MNFVLPMLIINCINFRISFAEDKFDNIIRKLSVILPDSLKINNIKLQEEEIRTFHTADILSTRLSPGYHHNPIILTLYFYPLNTFQKLIIIRNMLYFPFSFSHS